MKNLAWAAMCAASLSHNAFSIPNYYDPKNIIASHERGSEGSYWFFRLDHDKIDFARGNPLMRMELLQRVNNELEQYRTSDAYATDPLKKQAVSLLERDCTTIRRELGIGKSVRDIFGYLLDQKPAEIFPGMQRSAKRLMGEAAPNLEVFQLRARLEEQYACLLGRLQSFVQSVQLSKTDVAVKRQIEDHLRKAYTAIIQEQGLQL